MMFRCITTLLGAAVMVAAAVLPAAGGEPDVRTFNQADLVFVGVVASSRLGPAVGLSDPPLYTVIVTFEKVEMLRGAKPDDLTFRRSVRTRTPPVYRKGTKLLVAANRHAYDPRRLAVASIIEPTAENLAAVKKAVTLPFGWAYEKGKPVSPWAKLGKNAWPKGVKSDAKAVCSKTGRPALRAGEGIVLKAAQVIPKQIKRYQNPFGDGKFKLTVTNTSQVAADVPALLADGGRISWAGSLLIFSRGTVHFLPGAGALGDPRPVRLEPGESVSAVIDVLPVSGIRWPRGGSRVIFTFCLGELTARNFFYYFSRRHDRLRREAIQKLEPGG